MGFASETSQMQIRIANHYTETFVSLLTN